MPLIAPSDYRPPAYLWNGHLQTIVPSLFRTVPYHYERERITTPDDDFLDLDWAYASRQSPVVSRQSASPSEPTSRRSRLTTEDSKLVILSHGLEGDSTRPYITGMVRHLTQHGYDCLPWNFRSCSGELNRQLRFYHSGATEDLELVVQHALAKGYRDISLIGFSWAVI